MSAYNNFVGDFPERCDDLLRHFVKPAIGQDREVTLMLAVATAGFVIPFERLRQPKDPERQHPARDRERFEEAARKLDELLQLKFLESPLWGGPAESWIFAKEVLDEQQELDLWPELRQQKPLSSGKKAGSTLKHLRNALAHGNIYTHGDPIDLLVFLSRPSEESPTYAMLAVAPGDFHKFLQNWFSFLSSLQIPAVIYEGAMVA